MFFKVLVVNVDNTTEFYKSTTPQLNVVEPFGALGPCGALSTGVQRTKNGQI